MLLFIVVQSFVGSLSWSSPFVVCSVAAMGVDAVNFYIEDFSMLPSGGYGGFDFLLLLNHCNV